MKAKAAWLPLQIGLLVCCMYVVLQDSLQRVSAASAKFMAG